VFRKGHEFYWRATDKAGRCIRSMDGEADAYEARLAADNALKDTSGEEAQYIVRELEGRKR
jgi:hypothetical protein